ncbi:hypothetical protein ACGWIJ_000793 [Enterococcus hirae]|uniref:hypothetical protein n=1 Tax=Enterococcus faecium TaxID=1352 RepID=UPI00204D1306|nr:hypothetical protein [Enterococcus faecium]MDA3770853.1 hypothetical protein [Enterococcus faecium]MEB6013745.1 hypothetical protein [Enterococcus faecium]DAL86258.1 MAG TPA: hypothetical protein [Caudoviricetes sp.]
MADKIFITMTDGEKLEINENTLLTCIQNDKESIKADSIFYSKIIYQNFPLKESNPIVSDQTSSPLVGFMGLFSSCDFFTFSDDIDASNTVVYKTSAIKSIEIN